MSSAVVYFVADLYPWWGLPLAFIFAELGNYHRRHGARGKFFLFSALSLVFISIGGAYFILNGFEKLRPAMQQLERVLRNK